MDLVPDSACHSPGVQCWNCATGIPDGVALCPGCGLPPRGRPAPGAEPAPRAAAEPVAAPKAPRDPDAPLFGPPSPVTPQAPPVPPVTPERPTAQPEEAAPQPAPEPGGAYLFGPGPSAPAADRPFFSPPTPAAGRSAPAAP